MIVRVERLVYNGYAKMGDRYVRADPPEFMYLNTDDLSSLRWNEDGEDNGAWHWATTGGTIHPLRLSDEEIARITGGQQEPQTQPTVDAADELTWWKQWTFKLTEKFHRRSEHTADRWQDCTSYSCKTVMERARRAIPRKTVPEQLDAPAAPAIPNILTAKRQQRPSPFGSIEKKEDTSE